MSIFTIAVSPAIPQPHQLYTEFDPQRYDPAKARSCIPSEYDVTYKIGENGFKYYPTNLLNVMYTMIDEYNDIRNRKSHYMELCGYTVLFMNISRIGVTFFDPTEMIGDDFGQPLNEPIDCGEIESEFQRVASAVWERLSESMKE